MNHVNVWIWVISVAVVIGFFIFDFYSHVRHAHTPSLRESGSWAAFYVALSIVFMFVIAWAWNWSHAGDFITGYFTEKALSVDNLFVFLLIFRAFRVPQEAQQKVLLVGIAIALALRTVFIVAGAWVLNAWSWVFYIFGAWLLYIGIRQFIESFRDEEPEMPRWVSGLRRVVRTSEHYNSDKWTIRENGKRALTPLAIVIVALGFTDLLFALDSIPAIFGITTEPYLVFMANALALMGLRQLYFLLDGLMSRLRFLDFGLGFILSFIGVKMVFDALRENELPFINGGQHITFLPEIPTWFSLVFIFGVLAITIVASLVYAGRQHGEAPAVPDGGVQDAAAKDAV